MSSIILRKDAPQGGIASPTLANIALDGLEKTVQEATEKRRKYTL